MIKLLVFIFFLSARIKIGKNTLFGYSERVVIYGYFKKIFFIEPVFRKGSVVADIPAKIIKTNIIREDYV